jgi:predicted phosphodiesterase
MNRHSLRAATSQVAAKSGVSTKDVRTAIKSADAARKLVLTPPKRSLILPNRSLIAPDRAELYSQMRIGGTDPTMFNSLTYNGILPVELPNGMKVAILPDIHSPAHDVRVMWAVKAWLFDYKPDILIFIGDLADVFALSAWPTSPRIPTDLNMEIRVTRELLNELIRISGCRHTFVIMGNHEDRTRRWLQNFGGKVANLSNPQSLEPVLSFHEMLGYGPDDHITFIYDRKQAGGMGGGILLNRLLKLIHGTKVRPNPGASPRAVTDDFLESVLHGHTHRLAENFKVTLKGILTSREIGVLANANHPYLSYMDLLSNFHHGFMAAEVVNGQLMGNIVPIVQIPTEGNRRKSVFHFDGKLYKAADRG